MPRGVRGFEAVLEIPSLSRKAARGPIVESFVCGLAVVDGLLSGSLKILRGMCTLCCICEI